MSKLDRLAGALHGAGFILIVVYLLPSAFGVEIPDGSWLLLVGLSLGIIGGIMEVLGRSAKQESARNA